VTTNHQKGWIIVPNWDDFQHYKDRVPPWIKLYLELADKAEWRRLTLAERGLLVSIWIAFARTRGVVRASELPSFVAASTREKHLTSLSDAGFIRIRASKPLALEKRRIKEKEKKASTAAPDKLAPAAAKTNKTPYQRAREWVLVNGWQLSDSDLHEMLGAQFGIEAPLRAKLAELANRVQQQQQH
jgi:hypothetical protein